MGDTAVKSQLQGFDVDPELGFLAVEVCVRVPFRVCSQFSPRINCQNRDKALTKYNGMKNRRLCAEHDT